jgi:hypothetical protein
MRRRNFIALFGGATVGFPLTSWAGQSGKLSTVAYFGPSSPEWTNAFADRLR